MTTTRTHSREKLLYWKKIIKTAEASGGTRIAWMREHGISDGTYYYWHSALLKSGMLDTDDAGALETVTFPDTAKTQGDTIGLVEYRPAASSQQPARAEGISNIQLAGCQVMLSANGIQVYLGDSFTEQTLARVLEVVTHVK